MPIEFTDISERARGKGDDRSFLTLEDVKRTPQWEIATGVVAGRLRAVRPPSRSSVKSDAVIDIDAVYKGVGIRTGGERLSVKFWLVGRRKQVGMPKAGESVVAFFTEDRGDYSLLAGRGVIPREKEE
ncbi:MAG: hypothetical protein K2W96_27460 [Gemmataceae bacterium]|nr:hypothetical protein [Gemmataceae bacterium]